MPTANAQRFMELLLSDGELRRQFEDDPDAAIASSGLTLDEDDRELLAQIDASGTGEQLRERISKGGGNWSG